jgi:5-formyltetrahydrofolate cyclo-ligase
LAPQAEPDIILVPMLGFDRYGTRLGYGGGYYDRTLASLTKKPKLVGLAFAVQELPLIPRDTHDIPLDLVITEAGVHQFGAAA